MVQADFECPAESVFAAWIQPDCISRWMFGTAIRDETVLHIQANPVPGGMFSFLVDRQGVQVDHVGRYLIVDRPFKQQFTWSIGEITLNDSVVMLDIKSTESGCRLQLEHEMPLEWAGFIDRSSDAWGKMLVALKQDLVQSGKFTVFIEKNQDH
ncbi:MAG: SRPBCC domain-containing protein [Planctomycetota bacterium]|nr:SRPBCC domain-containing protein [Planctomycetota bacterium]